MATFIKLPVACDDCADGINDVYVNLDQVVYIDKPVESDNRDRKRFSKFYLSNGEVLFVEKEFHTIPHQLTQK